MADFPGGCRALPFDWIIIALTLPAALLVAISTGSDRAGRIVGFTIVAVWLLYEPLLVSIAGSTVGHYLCNLRVVDDKSRGNLGFLKAVARHAIKSLLGIYSFITIAATLRHQALHDLLRSSTVQIRDRSKAASSEYVVENAELLNPIMPSRLRRALTIVGYSIGSFVVFSILIHILASRACLSLHRCSSSDNVYLLSNELIFVAALAFFIIQGWRGRLLAAGYGARSRHRSAA